MGLSFNSYSSVVPIPQSRLKECRLTYLGFIYVTPIKTSLTSTYVCNFVIFFNIDCNPNSPIFICNQKSESAKQESKVR